MGDGHHGWAAADLLTFVRNLLVREVAGQVIRTGRGRKVVIVKFKRRKNYRRRQGHRQDYTAVRITRIEAGR